MKAQSRSFLFSLYLSTLVFGGCSTIGITSDESEESMHSEAGVLLRGAITQGSGFLDSYEGFTLSEDDKDFYVYYRDGTGRVFRGYDGFIMEDVIVYLDTEPGLIAIDPDEIAMLSDAFQGALLNQMRAGGYKLTDQAEPGVLHVRVALVGVEPIDALEDVNGHMNADTIIYGTHINVRNLAVEIEFLDSRTDERQVAFIDPMLGDDIDAIGGQATWEHVRTAFDSWAKRFRLRLDEIHQ